LLEQNEATLSITSFKEFQLIAIVRRLSLDLTLRTLAYTFFRGNIPKTRSEFLRNARFYEIKQNKTRLCVTLHEYLMIPNCCTYWRDETYWPNIIE